MPIDRIGAMTWALLLAAATTAWAQAGAADSTIIWQPRKFGTIQPGGQPFISNGLPLPSEPVAGAPFSTASPPAAQPRGERETEKTGPEQIPTRPDPANERGQRDRGR
jgi:hypothetical protein